MVMPLWYDQLVEKLAREREEGNKGAWENKKHDPLPITPLGEAILPIQPKRRGRPKGSKNKPKVK